MSTATEKRRMRNAYACKVTRVGHGTVRFVVYGDSPSGRAVQFEIETLFHNFPCLAGSFKDAWVIEREERLGQIQRINAALPKDKE